MRFLRTLCLAVAVAGCVALAGEQPWFQDQYAVRVPVTVTVSEPGWQVVGIEPAAVTEWINATAEFPFEVQSFAHDNVRLVEDAGRVIEGAFRVLIGEELVENGGFEVVEDGRPVGWKLSTAEGFEVVPENGGDNWVLSVRGADRHACHQSVPTELHTWYRFSFRAKGNANPGVLIMYGSLKGAYVPVERSFFDPATTLSSWRETSYYYYTGDKSDWLTQTVSVRVERFTGQADDASLRRCEVAFVANMPTVGTRRCYLYYAPVEGPLPSPPSREIEAMPERTAAVERVGAVEWLDDALSRTVCSTPGGDLWWLPTTRKLKVSDPAPALTAAEVRLECARNESEAVQLAFKPKADGRVQSVAVRLTGPDGLVAPASWIDVRRAHYVPIHASSTYAHGGQIRPTRFEFTGQLPDPLPAFAPVDVTAGVAPVLVWVDISVPVGAAAGAYKGVITLATDSQPLTVPLRLDVWDFALPARPTCRTAFGINQYANQMLFPFHKVETKEEKYSLTRDYIRTLLRYKISPKAPAAAYHWHPDGPATRKDPSSLVRLYETELPFVLDELNATGVLATAWSGPVLGRGEKTAEDGRKEALVMETVAEALKANGWLDRAYVWIDEPRPNAYDMIHKWVGFIREQPHARELKIFPLVYNGQAYEGLGDVADMMAFWDGEYPHSVFSPQRVRRNPDRFEPWSYFTRCTHLWIDAPGIDQRFWAPKVWAMGGRGMAIWGVCQWWTLTNSPHKIGNPWDDPMVTWGNGALSFFYPPSPLGEGLPEKDMTIVPSLRLLLTRDGIEDFEYGAILERLIAEAGRRNIPADSAEAALTAMRRPFDSPVHWNLCQTYWQNTRVSAARAIVALSQRLP